PKYHVIIDTDGAIDDMRAISMLLSANDIRVLAVNCSQGTLAPEMVFVKVNSLLSAFSHEGIPVGISEEINSGLPAWASFAQDIRWANEMNIQHVDSKRKSIEILNSTIDNYQNKVTLIALGSLKTYADWIKADRNVVEKIKRIIWYNNHNIEEGFNYRVSPESFNYIKQSGISLDVVASNTGDLIVNQDYLNHIHSTNSIYASQIKDVHSQESVVEKINDKHLHLWDDIVPLYLTIPILFEIEAKQNIKLVSINQQIPPSFINETIGKLLISANSTNNRVFKAFPIDTALYKMDYAKMLNKTIGKYGVIEWKAISMTNEIHGHTGIYSIIGAKMGIRAMEYFNVGINNLLVKTFAGNKPPLSCFNDGIQISTGATIGQGLITISDSISATPSAIFEFNNQQVNIAVIPEIAEQMQNDIEYGITNYGLQSDKYWLYIEELAIKYWAEYDRKAIFVIEKM
ncbi:MAG: nucleoside hydrolase, partial [Bacteroidota bacterium]